MGEAKHKKLYELLKAEILEGKYGKACAFPSEAQLARRHSYSRTTIRKALDELRHDGLIRCSQGKGTLVTRSVASRKIGLIVPDANTAELFFPIVREISRLAHDEGYALFFNTLPCKTDDVMKYLKDVVDRLIAERVAGVIFQPTGFASDVNAKNREILRGLQNAKIPVVLCDCGITDLTEEESFDVVGIDNVRAGALMAKHLLSVGARRIDFVLRSNAVMSHVNHVRGARMAIEESGLKSCRFRRIVAEPDDATTLKRCFARYKPDAIICGNDEIAEKCCRTLEKLGFSVPEDILVCGFGDGEIAARMSPSLTTIRLPGLGMARAAFERLVRRIKDPDLPLCEIDLAAPLVVRKSTSRTEQRTPKRCLTAGRGKRNV